MAKKSFRASLSPSSAQTAWGALYLLFQILALSEVLHLINGLLPTPLPNSRLNLIYFILNFLAAVTIFHKYLANHLSSLGRNWWACLKALILGYVFYWLSSYALSWLLGKAIPGFANLNDNAIAAMAGNDYWVVAVGVVILVPLAEEVFHRGLVFGGLYAHSRIAAYVVSCLLFAAIHVAGYIGSASVPVLIGCLVQYLPAGLCLAWSFQESGCIFVPILIHTLINAQAIYAMR